MESRSLKGIHERVEIFLLDWRDTSRMPTAVEIVECGELHRVPCQTRVRLGRLDEHDGKRANDIVLVHPDADLARRISRWHAELEMTEDGYMLRAVGRAATEVNRHPLAEGERALVRPGTVVQLGNVLTLRFLVPEAGQDSTVVADG